ncbi:COQ9 family protein [Falsirhodobacter sp. 1013]|uniref:COQ9 family protein n=1 Tax=Falsirhodobacter sp. 1013 TaxID=3417566 RepID=UPI003EB90979
MSMESTEVKNAVIDAALAHVAFDGWSEATLRAALTDAGVSHGLGRALFPRGAVDLALAYHWRGDARMVDRAATVALDDMPYRQRVATLIRLRLEEADKEAVRRGSTLFALPQHAGDGARAIWHTADMIWRTLGDTSQDVNWYTKRVTLSGVYAATVLFWLGDDSTDHQATWDFLDRRIEGVMKFEGLKARYAGNPLAKMAAFPLSWIRAPKGRDDMPGRMS